MGFLIIDFAWKRPLPLDFANAEMTFCLHYHFYRPFLQLTATLATALPIFRREYYHQRDAAPGSPGCPSRVSLGDRHYCFLDLASITVHRCHFLLCRQLRRC